MKKVLGVIVFVIHFCLLNGYSQTPVWNWVVGLNTAGNEVTNDAVVDPVTGDVYAVGYWENNLSAFFPTGTLPSEDFSSTYGQDDGFVAKYDNSGSLQWAFKIGCNKKDRVNAIEIDPSGNIYITGYFEDNTAEFTGTGALTGTTSLVNADNDHDFFIAKYNSDGELLWVRQGNSTGGRDIEGIDVAAYNSGVVAVGYFNDDTNFGALTVSDLGNFNQTFVVSYDENGNEQWFAYGATNNHDNNTKSYFNGVETDGTNVFITGNFKGPDFELYDKTNSLVSTVVNSNDGDAEIVLISFSVGGNFNWIQKIGGTNHEEDRGLVLDNDSIYITGGIGNNANFPGYTDNPVSSSGNMDIFVSSHSKIDGITGWVRSISSTNAGDQIGTSITSDNYSNILLTGYYDGNLNFSGTMLTPVGGDDGFIASYTNDGVYYWAKTIGSGGNDYGYGISSNSSDYVYVAGNYRDLANLDGNILSNNGGDNAFLAEIDPCRDAVGGIANSVDSDICLGENATITLVGYEGNIQWQSSPDGLGVWSDIVGETSANLLVAPASTTDYRAILTPLSCNSDTSSELTINVHAYPTATITGTATICEGNNTPIDIDLTGSQPFDFTYSDGTSNFNVVGYVAANYNTNVSPVTNKTYSVTSVADANGCTSAGLGNAIISVNAQVAISTQPASKSVCPGSNVSFSVIASGQDLNYQWKKDGINIPGETNPVLLLNSVGVPDVATYSCEVTSSCGGPLISNNAELTLYNNTEISFHPVDAYLCDGNELNLSVTSTGSNLTYQWKKDGIDIIGENANVLIINPVTTADGGSYTCEVTGSCGVLESDPALVEVDAPIVITTQPASKSACPSSNVSFTVTATGTNLSYQWKKDGIDILGETSQSLIINGVVLADEANYRCEISSLCGESKLSGIASLIVKTAIQITSNPVDIVECLGGNASFQVTALGSGLTYQWLKNGAPIVDGGSISGVLTDQLIITGLLITDIGEYKCEVTGDCGTLESSLANLVVDDAIAISSQPTNQSACEGNNITFSVAATGSNLTYQWQKDLIDIVGATNPTLNLLSVNASGEGDYRCVISNSCGESLISNEGVLTIYDATNITIQPIDAIECMGNSIILSVSASGSSLTYQWYKNGMPMVNGGDISGALSDNLIIANLDLSDGATYYSRVNGDCGFVDSDPAILTIDDNISVTIQPQDLQACETDNISFNVVASGSDLSYQWQKNGIDIIGKINSVLTLNNISAADIASYRCVISNSCGSILNSQSADLNLYSNTSIIDQPIDVEKCIGQNANFIVSAAGSNLFYQWKKNGTDLVDGGNISGSTSNTLNILGIISGDDGVYTCEVSGSCNNVNSDPANLIINQSTVIANHPSSQSVCPDANAIFNVAATGTNLIYQWQKDGIDILGETNSGLLLNNVIAGDAGIYRCLVSGECGTAISNGALLTINADLAITVQPLDDDVCVGESAGFSVTVTGSGLTYQWQYNGVDLIDGGNISGATTSNLIIDPVTITNAGIYTCIISGSCGTEITDPATLVVKEETLISTHPQNKTACPNDNISFNVIVTGTNLTYQWQKNGVNILGEINSSMILNNILSGDEGVYRCVIIGDCSTISSNGASLTVNSEVSITTQPANKEVCDGDVVSFNVSASGSGISYQWKHNGIDLIDGGSTSGVNTNNLIIDPVIEADEGAYTCEISGSCSSVNSNTVSLIVNDNIAITNHPVNLTACPLENATFSITASGTNLSYQWQKDDVDIIGETNPGLTIAGITDFDEGTYRCIVTGYCGSSASNGALLIVDESVSITTQPIAAINLCEGDNLNINVSATGTGLNYQWQKNGIDIVNGGDISGANSDNLVISNLSENDDGIYTCIVTGSCASVTSNISDVTIYPTTLITQHPIEYIIVEGGDATFSILAEGDNLIYQWQKDGLNLIDGGIISGSTTTTLSLTGVAEIDEGAYRCVVTGTCNISNSNPASLIVNPTSNITTQPIDIERCVGETAGFSIVATGGVTYQWKLDGVDLVDNANITGTSTANLSINSVNLTDDGAYTCIVNSESSAPAILTVHENTIINTQPTAKTRCSDDNVIFTVNASGSALSYQWKKDGSDLADGGTISGSNTETLSISSVVVSDQGNYTCLVSGVCVNASSNPAELIVYQNTLITSQPAGATICINESYTFTIAAEGDNLIYEWKKDGNLLADGGNVSGATTTNLVISNADISDAGSYTCSVTGECGFEVSVIAQLYVEAETSITIQPTDATGCEGDNINFSIFAEGEGLVYQWQKDGINVVDGGTISGSLTPILSINGIIPSDAGSYVCVVNGNCGSQNSIPAELMSYQNTSITNQPIGGTICENSTISLNVIAVGDNLTYQWKKGASDVTDGGNISGATTANLVISSADISDAGTYSCHVAGSCGTENSSLAFVIIEEQTQITLQPIDISACSGDNVNFSVLANGTGISYQWQMDGLDLADGGKITGSSSSLLNVANLSPIDAGSYRCVVNGSCNVENSNSAILSSYDNTLITVHPADKNVCEGDQITLNVTATGDNLVYQWKKDGVDLSDIGNVSGSNTSNLIINSSLVVNGGIYTCNVSGSCGNENSTAATVNVISVTEIETQPQNIIRCEGELAIFSVDANGESLTYLWYKDGAPLVDGGNIFGSTSNVLTINNLIATDAGSYSCVVTGTCGFVNSDAAGLTVNVYPSAGGVIVGPTDVCQGSTYVMYEVAAIANADFYKWNLPIGISILTGDSTRVIEVEVSENELGGNITVQGVNQCGEGALSPALSVSANPIPVANAGADQIICVDSTYLTAVHPGTATGVWTVVDGPAIFQDVNLNNTLVYNLRQGTNILIWTVEKNSCFSSDTVVIVNNHVDVDAGTDQTICSEDIVLEGSSVPSGAVGSWSVLSGNASFSDGNDPVTVANDFASGNNILKWSITKGGCASFDTVNIDNQRPTQAYAGIDLSICKDSTVLSANTPIVGTGLWTVITGAATFTDETDPNTAVQNLSQGDNILRWTLSNGICNTIDEVTISNNIVDANAGVDQILCDRTTTLGAELSLTGVGNWSVISGSAAFVNNNLNNTTVTGLSQGENILAWNINNNGCISIDSVSIINDSPSESDAGDDQVIAVDFTTLQANIPIVGTGSWSLISGSAVIIDPALYNTNVTGLALGDNIFRWTIVHNSCTSYSDVVITNFMSTATDAGPDQTICSDETALVGNEPVFGFGEWSVIQGAAIFVDNSDPYTEVSGLAKGDNILQWSVWENGWTSDDVVITNDSPTLPNAGLDQTLCIDSTFLSGNEPVVGSGKWTVISGSGTFENDTIYNTKVTNLSNGKNKFKWTITNKSCSFSDIVIITNDLPTIADAGIDQISCLGEVTLTPNTPSFGIGEWSVQSGSASFSGNEATNLAIGPNILRWTIVSNSCSSYDDVTITNNEPSNANAGANKVICYDSIYLAANTPIVGTGIWTIQSGSATILDVNDPTSKVTDLNQGINVFRWTITYNGCTKYDEVTINNAFIEATTGLDQEICSETTILEANSPDAGAGTWSVLGGSGAAIFDDLHQPDTRVSGLDKGANILRWTITNESCVSYSDVVITNNLPTEAFAGPNEAICDDNTLLNANTPIVGIGEWSILSGSATITDVNNANSNINNLDYGVNTLRWTITNGSCASSDEVVISNNSTIVSNAGIDQSLCTDSVVLYANAPANGIGNWAVVSGSATFIDNNDYNTQVINIGKGTNILRWVISNGECVSSDEVTIINNSPSNAIAGGDQTICGNTTNLQANTPSVGTGLWSLVSGAATFENRSQNNTLVTGLNPGTNTLRWSITNNGCTLYDDVVIFNDLPYEADAGSDFDICGTETPLFANDPVIGSGQWTVISGSATFNDASQFDAIVSNLGFGANTLRWTIEYDNCTTYDEIVVTNNKMNIYAGVDQTVNTSGTLLAANNPSSGTGKWTVLGGTGTFANQNSAITQVSNLGPGLNTFRWSVVINGCTSYDDVAVIYNVPPTASFVVTKLEGCPPLEAYFINNSLDNLSFVWDFGDGTSSDQVTVKHVYTEPGTYSPSLTVISEEGEIIVKDTLITVFAQPKADFIIVNKQVYIPEEEAIFINSSTDAVNYQWEFGEGGLSADSDPRYIYKEEGKYDIILHAWSDKNCYDSTKIASGVEVIESGTIIFPNAFTPNTNGPSGGYYNSNDFTNDVFYPIGEGIENYHLEIFNKWGAMVFESSDINIGWDGYYKEELLNEGVYVWKVTGNYNNGKNFQKVGTVLLLH